MLLFSVSESLIPKVYAQYSNWVWLLSSRRLFIKADATKGYSEATAYDCQDIIDSGVVPSIYYNISASGTQFEFDFRIIITVLNTDATWFVDTDKQITFTSTAPTGASQILFHVYNKGHARFGTVINATSRTSWQGCSITALDSLSGMKVLRVDAGGELCLYSSTIHATGSSHLIESYGDTKIYNCILGSYVTTQIRSSTITYELFNTLFLNDWSVRYTSAIGMSDVPSDAYFDKLTITKAVEIFNIGSANNGTLKNVYSRECSRIAYLGTGWSGNAWLINVDSDVWSFLWAGSGHTGEVYRQYEFDLTVQNSTTPIQNANVTLYDKDGTQVFTELTDANGEIATKTVSRGWYQQSTGDTLNDLSPHNLTITASGYQTYTKNFTLSEKTDWTIALTESEPPEQYNPIARFTFTPSNPIPAETLIQFNATESLDIDGNITEYFWDFGDDTFADEFSENIAPLEQSTTPIDYLHGSIYYNSYIYVCERSTYGRVAKIKGEDYSDQLIVQVVRDGTNASYLTDIIEEDGFIWVVGGNGYLYKLNASTLATIGYWQVLPNTIHSVCSNGTHIYVCGFHSYVGVFNISTEAHSNNQLPSGNGVTFHSILEHGDCLFINDITNNAVRQVFKVNLTEADSVSLGYQLTDDMVKDEAYVYGGIETNPGGITQIRMSDLAITDYRNASVGISYGCFCLDNRILILDQQNNTIWIFDSSLTLVRQVNITNLDFPQGINEMAISTYDLHLTQYKATPSPIIRLSRQDVMGWLSGVTINHTYTISGTYNVTLIITDNDGLTSSFSQLIIVQSTSLSEGFVFGGILVAMVMLVFGLAYFGKKT